MQETLVRQWQLLRLLPQSPLRASAPALTAELAALGHPVELRTVQRDLHKLAESFPIEVEENHKPFGWSWRAQAPLRELPSMSPDEAMALLFAQSLLASWPQAVRSGLQRYVLRAREVLGPAGQAAWEQRVTVVPPAPAEGPALRPEVLAACHRALLDRRQLQLHVRAPGEKRGRSSKVHPVELRVAAGALALVVLVGDATEATPIDLAHCTSATVLEAAARARG